MKQVNRWRKRPFTAKIVNNGGGQPWMSENYGIIKASSRIIKQGHSNGIMKKMWEAVRNFCNVVLRQ